MADTKTLELECCFTCSENRSKPLWLKEVPDEDKGQAGPGWSEDSQGRSLVSFQMWQEAAGVPRSQKQSLTPQKEQG